MQDHHHIYIKVNGTDTPLRLTSTDKDDGSPAWAPEGQSIAFVRKMSDTANAICTISPLGGRERRIAEIGGPLTEGPLAGGPVAETDIDRVVLD